MAGYECLRHVGGTGTILPVQTLFVPPYAHDQEAQGVLHGKAQHGKEPAQNARNRKRIERCM